MVLLVESFYLYEDEDIPQGGHELCVDSGRCGGGGCPGTGVRGRSCVIPTSVCGHVLLQDDKPEVGGLTGRRSWCGNYPVRLPSAVISDPARERA